MARHATNQLLSGAYRFYERHLAELDEAMNVFADGQSAISVSLEGGKSFSSDTLVGILTHPLVETSRILSIEAGKTKYSEQSYRASFFSSGYDSYGVFRFSAEGESSLVDAFEARMLAVEKRVKMKHLIYYNIWREVVFGCSISFLFLLLLHDFLDKFSPSSGISSMIVGTFYGVIATAISFSLISASRKTYPTFVIEAGEGVRWHERLAGPRRWVFKTIFGVIFTAIFAAIGRWAIAQARHFFNYTI